MAETRKNETPPAPINPEAINNMAEKLNAIELQIQELETWKSTLDTHITPPAPTNQEAINKMTERLNAIEPQIRELKTWQSTQRIPSPYNDTGIKQKNKELEGKVTSLEKAQGTFATQASLHDLEDKITKKIDDNDYGYLLYYVFVVLVVLCAFILAFAIAYTATTIVSFQKINKFGNSGSEDVTESGTPGEEGGSEETPGVDELAAVLQSAGEGYLYFGTYPQSEVTDGDLQSALTTQAGDVASWTSYDYYIDGNTRNFMKYKDVTYDEEKYRGVYFTSYRPSDTIRNQSHRLVFDETSIYSFLKQ